MAVMTRVSLAANEQLSEGKPTAVQDVGLQLGSYSTKRERDQ